MNATTFLKRALVGIGFLAAASAPSALDLHPGAPGLFALAAQQMDLFAAASAGRETDGFWLACAALGIMGVVVKRRSKL